MEEDLTEAGSTRPWPAERTERWAIERLIPYADNARIHSEADVDKLADLLRRFGCTNPALVDEDGVLICGHGRIRGAAKLGLNWVPVMVARGWSEEEKRAYRLADNQLTLRGAWDLVGIAQAAPSQARQDARQPMSGAKHCTELSPLPASLRAASSCARRSSGSGSILASDDNRRVPSRFRCPPGRHRQDRRVLPEDIAQTLSR